MNKIHLKIIIPSFILFCSIAQAQIHIGPKVGLLYYALDYEDSKPLDSVKISSDFEFTYHAGVSFIYDIAKKYALNIDILYTKKGKNLAGGMEGQFSHKATYHYIEAPLLFKYYFRKTKTHKAFVHLGGRFCYWLSGNGEVKSWELERNGIDLYEYDIEFRNPSSIPSETTINVQEPNRVQVGLDIGFGALLNTLHPKNKILIEGGFQYGHSWLGDDKMSQISLITEYSEDFRSSYLTFSFSVGYMFGKNLGEGKEGKSTSKVKHKFKIKKNKRRKR